jgi:leucyl/phenylalanyl-tRNA--protein transferase
MPSIPRLATDAQFPPTCQALADPNGLLAVGGDLSAERLLSAYRRGIFPWYEAPQPVLWWTPDPRSVLVPDELHVSRSLRRTLRTNKFTVNVDRAFSAVMQACAQPRDYATGTWIDPAMVAAYTGLHDAGYAHSVEVTDQSGALVGGLYGVALGRVFFGESMFSTQADASKTALVALTAILREAGFTLIDCQVESEHMNSLGARNISRLDFEQRLEQTVNDATDAAIWTFTAGSGDLL